MFISIRFYAIWQPIIYKNLHNFKILAHCKREGSLGGHLASEKKYMKWPLSKKAPASPHLDEVENYKLAKSAITLSLAGVYNFLDTPQTLNQKLYDLQVRNQGMMKYF